MDFKGVARGVGGVYQCSPEEKIGTNSRFPIHPRLPFPLVPLLPPITHACSNSLTSPLTTSGEEEEEKKPFVHAFRHTIFLPETGRERKQSITTKGARNITMLKLKHPALCSPVFHSSSHEKMRFVENRGVLKM